MRDMPLVILASARKQGDTARFIEFVFQDITFELIDLLDYQILPYNYNHYYSEKDDFLKIVATMLEYQVIVFATPVYWYAMSGLLKIFFDRLTDLTTPHKSMGKQLKGKSVFLLAIGSDPALPEGFEIPFQLTANYFDLCYQGYIYHSLKLPFTETQSESKAFTTRIKSIIANPLLS